MKARLAAELETARMRLQRMGNEHFELLKRFWANPMVAEFTLGEPLDEEHAWLALAANVGHWSIRGYGMYCAFEKLSGDFIGTLGLWNPPTWPEPEYACALLPKYWGGRYGVEGGRRFIDLVQRELGWSTLVSLVRQGNEKSFRGLARLGAKYDRDVRVLGRDWQMHRLFQAGDAQPNAAHRTSGLHPLLSLGPNKTFSA